MQKNKKNRYQFALLGLLSLLIGLSLYLTCNKDAIISKLVYSYFGIKSFEIPETAIVRCIRNWGADLLWMLSFTLFMQAILGLDKVKLFYLILCVLLGVAYEILQYTGFAIGTADIGDIVAYIIGNLLAIVIIKLHKEDRKI